MPPPREPPDDATLRSPVRQSSAAAQALPLLDGARYQVNGGNDALLGKGGQGSVWLARDDLLRREVALKRLHPDAQKDPAQVAAFVHEARLTALLEHQGIVPLHDVGRADDGAPTIVLRRIEGKSLAETLHERRTLDERLPLVPAVLRACQAVAFAHQRGVVHRDLKPQNVMLGAFGETYVVDWGLALIDATSPHAELTAPREVGGIVGTPAYMSPEQALGLTADARSDVWGLGACLYEVLTGQPPITGRSVQSAVAHAASAEVPPVRMLQPGVPADLSAICEKALLAERSARYPTAGALAKDLERWLEGRTVSAREYSRWELFKRTVRANRAAFAVALVALLGMGVGVTLDEARVRGERNEARAFARRLLSDTSRIVQTRKADLALVGMLSSRVLQWLERGDLSLEEQAEVCGVLIQVANLHYDAQQWEEGRALDRRALTLAQAGAASAPDDPRFFVCRIDARADLGYVELQSGDAEAGLRAYAEAEADLTAWSGERTPEVTLAHAQLLEAWGTALWETAPAEGAERFVAAARLAVPLVRSGEPRIAKSALALVANGALGLWSQGRRAQAFELTQAFSGASERVCAEPDPGARRGCLAARGAFQHQLAWADDARAEGMLEEVRRRQAEVLALEPDSSTVLQDAMWTTFEQGDFAASSRFAAQLRARGGQDVPGLGALAGVLAGGPLPENVVGAAPADAAEALAVALHAAANGDYALAAKTLRGVERSTLWYRLSWTPHPKPALVLPPAARPAFERFLADFTRAYGEADSKALGASFEALADDLDALGR